MKFRILFDRVNYKVIDVCNAKTIKQAIDKAVVKWKKKIGEFPDILDIEKMEE